MASQAQTEVYTLRPFAIHVNGVPLAFPVKSPRKPLELLKVLIALGGEGVIEQMLSDTLWPDSDGDAAHHNFASTLYRLRRLIGREGMRLRDGRLSLIPGACWVDALAFTGLIEELQRTRERGDAEGVASLLGDLLALYRAPFLEGECSPPEILAARERLHSLFLRHLSEGTRWLASLGRPAEAAHLLGRALETDGLAEELHQQLIRCHIAQGRLSEARAAYQRCRRLLRESAGIDPSAETESLAREIGAAAPSAAEAPPEALAERRRVTLLMARWEPQDAACAGGDPEVAEAWQRRLRAAITAPIEAAGGVVNQIGALQCQAVFGLPSAHEDDPLRAARAGLALAHISLSAPEPGGAAVTLRCRVGIDTGLAVVHAGVAEEGRYRLAGAPVERSHAMAASAPPGEVWVGEQTWRLIEGYFRVKRVAGQDPAATWRLLGEAEARTPLEAAARRGFTPFTGRREELAVLGHCLQRALAGEGQFVTVTGEAGLGKSRLVHEFRQQATRERDTLTVLEGRCKSFGVGTPYLPLLDALRRGLSIRETDPPKELRRKAIANLLAIDPALERYLPLYLHLLSIPSAEHPLPTGLQAEALRRAQEEALAAVTTAQVRHGPMALIYEDWHWADEASESALANLLGLIPQHPLMVILVFRPEYRPRWSPPGNHTPIVLKALAPPESEAILRHKLGAARLPVGLAAQVHARTGGNPFFVEEVAQALLTGGAVRVEGEQAILARSLELIDLPTSVDAVIRSRMDRLDPDAREALRWAAVIGREFNRRVLERVYGAPTPLPQCLERLTDSEFIRQARVLPEPEYLFKHVLAQVAVYDSLLSDRRKAMHARVGGAIEALFADRLEEHYEALAHYYSQSDETGKAIEYLEKAGDKAAGVYSLEQARQHYREALVRLGSIADEIERKRTYVDLGLSWARVCTYAPSIELVKTLEHSLVFAEELQDHRSLRNIYYWLGHTHRHLGNGDLALLYAKRCLESAANSSDHTLIAMTHDLLGRTHYLLGEMNAATGFLKKAIRMLEQAGRPHEAGMAMSVLSICASHTGEFDLCPVMFERAMRIATPREDLQLESIAQHALGKFHFFEGNWSESLYRLNKSNSIAARIGERIVEGFNLFFMAQSTFLQVETETGIRMLRRAIEIVEEAGTGLLLSYVFGTMAECCALAGAIDEALSFARRSMERAAAGDRFGLAVVRRAMAIALAQVQPPDWPAVDNWFRDSIHIARDQGVHTQLGISYFRFAANLHSRREFHDARSQVETAVTLFREMGMKWWLDQAEALQAKLSPSGEVHGASGGNPI